MLLSMYISDVFARVHLFVFNLFVISNYNLLECIIAYSYSLIRTTQHHNPIPAAHHSKRAQLTQS